jgi:hypothetical protein
MPFRFAKDIEGFFRAWLVEADHTPRVIRQHVIRLDLILREMGKTADATYTIAQLDAAVSKHNVPPSQLVLFRGTQRRYRLYLPAQGRLTIPPVANPFAVLRDRIIRNSLKCEVLRHPH